MRHAMLWGLLSMLASYAHAGTNEGWIIGEPCATGRQVADCPLRHIDRPVLLLADGTAVPFVHGEGSSIAPDALDKAYGKKVRLTGDIRQGVLQPVRLEVLEVSGERKFFKGCL